MTSRLDLDRAHVLAHRRRVGSLDERLPAGADSLRIAAWAGLQDSVPRAAVLSIHARVAETTPHAWEDPSLAQLWGPRFAAYVVAERDLAVFGLGRLPLDAPAVRRAEDLAERLAMFLDGRRLPYGEAGRALGVDPNALRYAAATGTVRIRWDGARQPTIWTVAPPEIGASAARVELARRHLHVFGPSTVAGFGRWAGVRSPTARDAFERLRPALLPARRNIARRALRLTEEIGE
ncbi:MAG TPA: crosslink repair DNA glycosylase YcaQ family protein, partial [Candidatus Dormibacteraeota bacterium]|nr:crosslink repair DNA glycosylase YcaQ family protein [Candidatus Dormibacteraeota bacterium]